MSRLPRIIWMYWAQGWDTAPTLSKHARLSWQRRNPTWNLLPLDLPTVAALLGADWQRSALPDTITPTALSNLVRLELLRRFGGVWADATTFCVRPLDEWIDKHTASGFFAFEKPGPDRPLASWFLAAQPGSYMVRAWADASWEYWDGREKMDEFHWVHRRFGNLLDTDPDFAAAWAQVAHISADNPLHIGPGRPGLNQPPSEKVLQAVKEATIPVCKLTNRVKPGPPGSTMNHLRQVLRDPLK